MSEIRFAFGSNWQSFVENAVDEQRIARALGSVKKLLAVEDLAGRTFLDIGCGSGLFSLAACILGAERVTSFDFDAQSVEASIALRTRAGVSEAKWRILRGSILDATFLAQIEPAHAVYAWGVLHHTGAMWDAIDKAVGKVLPGGRVVLAIYNDVESLVGGSRAWWWMKRFYNRSPALLRRLMEGCYGGSILARKLVRLRSPFRHVREYSAQSGRGMDFWHDIRDWLGGFPYEYATAGAVFRHVYERHRLTLAYLDTHDGHGCNEFVFSRMTPES